MNRDGKNLANRSAACVLAGGRGSRLMELTDKQAKPAVFFGGKCRIIDFALSNAFNSGIRRICVATQYEAHSLIRHLQYGWSLFSAGHNDTFDVLPAGQRSSSSQWYAGTADALFQNMAIIAGYNPEHIVVLAGDHVYKMDYEPMLRQHVEAEADVTIGCIEVPRLEASAFGVMAVDGNDRITAFLEKPRQPPGIADSPDRALASMGIYVFSTRFLFDQLKRDAVDARSSHDFGRDLIPYILRNGTAVAHRFARSCVRSANEAEPYWRDVGTIDAYWQANIDLTSLTPALDLDDPGWPIRTRADIMSPARFVSDRDHRCGSAIDSSISGGCIISSASLRRSLLFTGVRIESYAQLEGAVVLPGVQIGRNARLSNVVVDRGVRIPDRLVVGEDARCDAQSFRRTERGICLVTQSMIDRIAGLT
jgi:glucose-1-phosphate adenylyltransferase